MPTWVTPVIGLITLIFGAGGAWAVSAYRQRKSETTQTDLVKELKDCISKLRDVVTEVEIIKVANARLDRTSEEHDKRISACEIALAKLQPRRRK